MKCTKIQSQFNAYDTELLESLNFLNDTWDYLEDEEARWLQMLKKEEKKPINENWKILKSAGAIFTIELLPLQKYPMICAVVDDLNEFGYKDRTHASYHPTLSYNHQRNRYSQNHTYLNAAYVADHDHADSLKNLDFFYAMRHAKKGFYFDDAMKSILSKLVKENSSVVINALSKSRTRRARKSGSTATDNARKYVNKNYEIIKRSGYSIKQPNKDFDKIFFCKCRKRDKVSLYAYCCELTHSLTPIYDEPARNNDTETATHSKEQLYKFSPRVDLEYLATTSRRGSKLDRIMSTVIDAIPSIKALKEVSELSAALPATPLQQAPRKSSKRL